jgi:hypothetical protein
MTRQSLTVRDGEGSASASRSSTPAVSATLGVRYAVWSRRIWLHSFASFGEELTDLHALVGLHQHALYRFGLTPWLEMRAGLGLSATLDVTQTAFSSGTLCVLGGVQVWRIELLWSPALQFPLAATSRTVGDTEIARKMAVGILPLSFALRFSFGPYGASDSASPQVRKAVAR